MLAILCRISIQNISRLPLAKMGIIKKFTEYILNQNNTVLTEDITLPRLQAIKALTYFAKEAASRSKFKQSGNTEVGAGPVCEERRSCATLPLSTQKSTSQNITPLELVVKLIDEEVNHYSSNQNPDEGRVLEQLLSIFYDFYYDMQALKLLKSYGLCQVLIKFLGKLRPSQNQSQNDQNNQIFVNNWIDSEAIDVRNTKSCDETNFSTKPGSGNLSITPKGHNQNRSRCRSTSESRSDRETEKQNSKIEKLEKFYNEFERDSSNGYTSGFTSGNTSASSCTNSDTESDVSSTSLTSKSSMNSGLSGSVTSDGIDGPKKVFKKRSRRDKNGDGNKKREHRKRDSELHFDKDGPHMCHGVSDRDLERDIEKRDITDQENTNTSTYRSNFNNTLKINQKYSVEYLEKNYLNSNLYESKMNKLLSILEKYSQNDRFFINSDGSTPFTIGSLIVENYDSFVNLLRPFYDCTYDRVFQISFLIYDQSIFYEHRKLN